MKTLSLFSVLSAAAMFLMAGCAKITSCSCDEYASTMYDPYTPERFSISWTEFNPLSKFEEYFYYHDSTAASHDGDTIKVYGYIYPTRPVGDTFIELLSSPTSEPCSCFRTTLVQLPPNERVEAWLTESRRLVYVKGVIENCGRGRVSQALLVRINALQYDSVMF